MASQNLEHIRRQIRRARGTVSMALSNPRPETASLVSLAPAFTEAAAAFERADAAVRGAQSASAKETAEALAALRPLAQQYDGVRSILAAKLGTPYRAASAYATPDDLITVCEAIEDELEARQAEPWTTPLLVALGPVLDAAVKEQLEGNAAMKALQKAQADREQAAGTLRPVFVSVRRSVRAAFGRSSREYRELRDRSAGAAEEEDDPDATDPDVVPIAGLPAGRPPGDPAAN
ncbi:MAG: hypothetical protein JW751_04150 [Polyangiaceae bacterium]|nr:hypothetical protein [Polyangiaceae bacterium]